jgi:hypothetical protein
LIGSSISGIACHNQIAKKNHMWMWSLKNLMLGKGNECDVQIQSIANKWKMMMDSNVVLLKCVFWFLLKVKTNIIKTRKSETKVDYSLNVMSSTFSFSFDLLKMLMYEGE